MNVYQIIEKLAPFTGYKIIGNNFQSHPYTKGKYYSSSVLQYCHYVVTKLKYHMSADYFMAHPWIYIYVSNTKDETINPLTIQDLLSVDIQGNLIIEHNESNFFFVKEIKIVEDNLYISLE